MKKFVFALLAGAVSVSAAYAGEEKAVEKAADVVVEKAVDVEAQVEARFKEVDIDADGIVTRAEYEADFAKKAEEAAAKGEAWDDERKVKAAADFAAMAGEDDAVTLAEAKAFVAARQAAAEAPAETTGQ